MAKKVPIPADDNNVVNPPDSPSANPPSISAEKLLRILLKENRRGNRARYKFSMALRTLFETRLFLKLGFSSVIQLADARFRCSRSKTFEMIRVAIALDDRPVCKEKFLAGDLSWSELRQITRVDADSEKLWLDFAEKNTFKALEREVSDAVRKRRKTPRKDGYGIPGLEVTISFRLSPEEHDLLEKAIEKASRELSASLGRSVEPRESLLYLAMRMVETDPEGIPQGRVESGDPIVTILYHWCPNCRKAHLITKEGPVEVPHDHVERHEGDAKVIEIPLEEELEVEVVPEEAGAPEDEIDGKNTPALRKKVLHRDGCICANPHCRRRVGLHGHHLRFRSKGGKTIVWNEVTCCVWCHSLIHLGLLKVSGTVTGGLVWTRVSDGIRADDGDGDAEAERGDEKAVEEEIAAIRKRMKKAGESTAVDRSKSGAPAADPARPESTVVDASNAVTPVDVELGVQILLGAGFKKDDAKARIGRAIEILRRSGEKYVQDQVFRLAISLGFRKPRTA